MNIRESLKANAQAFIYIFISDKDISKFNERIANKRAEQKKYLASLLNAPFVQLSVAETEALIASGIQEQYGMTPKEVLYRLAMGKPVRNKNGVSLVAGVGSTLPLNSKTGFPDGATYADNGIANYGGVDYYAVENTEAGTPIGVFNGQTGEQVSYYDSSTQQFQAGGNNDNSFWSWAHAILGGLMQLFNFLSKIFSGRDINKIRPFQQDGFYLGQETAGTAGGGLLFPLLIAGGVIYALNKAEPNDVASVREKYLKKKD